MTGWDSLCNLDCLDGSRGLLSCTSVGSGTRLSAYFNPHEFRVGCRKAIKPRLIHLGILDYRGYSSTRSGNTLVHHYKGITFTSSTSIQIYNTTVAATANGLILVIIYFYFFRFLRRCQKNKNENQCILICLSYYKIQMNYKPKKTISLRVRPGPSYREWGPENNKSSPTI